MSEIIPDGEKNMDERLHVTRHRAVSVFIVVGKYRICSQDRIEEIAMEGFN
jgi:hypothetical protein